MTILTWNTDFFFFVVSFRSEDKHVFRLRRILEPSIRVRHRRRAYWVLTYCVFWSTVIMVVFAAVPQRHA